MIDGLVRMDLDEPWGPEDAGAALDSMPAVILVAMLREIHVSIHAILRERRRAARRRPWRWHKLRELARTEADYCDELRRRTDLVKAFYRARCEAA